MTVPKIKTAAPLLSVVLATNTYETIRPVLAALRRQRFPSQIEPVIVLPFSTQEEVHGEELGAFAWARVVRIDSVFPLAQARAAGVRAASSPIVFIGETHTYPQPGWAEAMLTTFEQPWTAVVPAIGNANPAGPVSWAAYLFDYGTWGKNRPAGEMSDPPTHNTAYRRTALLALGDQLQVLLDPNQEALWPRLSAAGHRAFFAPNALILHLNVNRISSLIGEKYCVGFVRGMRRARRWSWYRRILYIVASPLIPVVLLIRLVRHARLSLPQEIPVGTIPAVMLCAGVNTLGEVLGYAGARIPSIEARLTDYEIRKVQYASP